MLRVPVLLLLMTLPLQSFAHGGVVEEEDLCVIKIAYLRAHFKIYVPEIRQHEQFCEDIPVRGESIFVMEYQHDGLSEAEIDFRIIENVTGKGTFARMEDVEAIEDIDAITIRYEPPAVVPDVFMLVQSFDHDGEYIGIVSARQLDTGKLYTAVFPFEVGYTGVGYWPLLLGGLLFLQLNYWFMSRRRTKARVATAAALLCSLVTPAEIYAADTQSNDNVWASDAGHFQVSFRGESQPIVINKIHNWVLHVTDAEGNAIGNATITVNGGMPDHNHGLPTAPVVTRIVAEDAGNEDGYFKVEGMRFHMRGYWEIRVLIDIGSERDSVTIPLQL